MSSQEELPELSMTHRHQEYEAPLRPLPDIWKNLKRIHFPYSWFVWRYQALMWFSKPKDWSQMTLMLPGTPWRVMFGPLGFYSGRFSPLPCSPTMGSPMNRFNREKELKCTMIWQGCIICTKYAIWSFCRHPCLVLSLMMTCAKISQWLYDRRWCSTSRTATC